MIHDWLSCFESSTGVQEKKKRKGGKKNPRVFLTPHPLHQRHSVSLQLQLSTGSRIKSPCQSLSFPTFHWVNKGAGRVRLMMPPCPRFLLENPVCLRVRLSCESSRHYAANSLSSSGGGMLVSNSERPERRRDSCLLPTPAVK